MISWPSADIEKNESAGTTVLGRRQSSKRPTERGDLARPDSVSVPAVERAIAILRYLEDNPERSAGTVSNAAPLP